MSPTFVSCSAARSPREDGFLQKGVGERGASQIDEELGQERINEVVEETTTGKALASSAEKENQAASAVHTVEGFRAAKYLVFGTVCALIGGTYSTYIVYAYSNTPSRNYNMEGEKFPSGKAYWPPSVSNMVSDPQSPQGKVWLAFMVTSAFFTIISWYPYELQNVYIGDDVSLFPFLRCWPAKPSMMTCRLFLPSIGILMVCLVHTAAPNVFDPAQNATLIFHTGGAILWIGVNIYTEIYTLAFAEHVVIGKQEKFIRWCCILVSLVGGVVYMVCQSFQPEDLGLCCGNEYRDVNMTTVEIARKNGAHAIAQNNLELMQWKSFDPQAAPPLYQGLYDTAYGWGLAWYMAEFWGECVAGFGMLLNTLVIWWFCKARAVTMPNELPTLSNA